jgi:uncharacterized protein (DUF4213/DUF364 family)
MTIAHEIINFLEPRASGREVRRALIGLCYTGVQLDDGGTGIAYTMRGSGRSGCSAFGGTRALAGGPAIELLRFLESTRTLEASVGLATANALAGGPPKGATSGDALDAVELFPTDRVTMVGFFGPLVQRVRERAAELVICDERRESVEGFVPASQAPYEISRSDVALITATSLLNGSMDALLEAAKGRRQTLVLGPSTPMLPECFAGGPVTCLSGVTITDPERLFEVLAEGGGTRRFMPFATKWNVRLHKV